MKILHIAAECAPLFKVGGMSDVINSLAKTMPDKLCKVDVLLPFHKKLINQQKLKPVKETSFSFKYEISHKASIYKLSYEGLNFYLLKIDTLNIFADENIYGKKNDAELYTIFCCAALEFLKYLSPDIVHLHDWHVSLLAGLIKTCSPTLNSKVVLTIHNFNYQGITSTKILKKTFIKPNSLKHYLISSNKICLLQGGIYYADTLTTVSPTYAKELLETKSSKKIQSILIKNKNKFYGILNGIDNDIWNPNTDKCLATNFHSGLLKTPNIFLKKKKNNKVRLEKLLKSSFVNKPLICIISRLVDQKGLVFIKQSILHALEHNYALIILGACFDQQNLNTFQNLQKNLIHNTSIKIILRHDETLARIVYAGSDMILIPSLFEPCGLTQLIAMRYGTIPLVRTTGGLSDTVFEGKNGFCFKRTHNFKDFYTMLNQALSTYQNNKTKWLSMIKKGMNMDFSQDKMAQNYLKIYKNLI